MVRLGLIAVGGMSPLPWQVMSMASSPGTLFPRGSPQALGQSSGFCAGHCGSAVPIQSVQWTCSLITLAPVKSPNSTELVAKTCMEF